MAKIDWDKQNAYDKIDHYTWAKKRNAIQDKKWKLHSMNYVPDKKTNINLGIHENHDWQPIKGPFGPHAGKIICKTCNDKWVSWLPKGTF